MANTVWKGQVTFGLVSFPVRLVRAARKDRVPLRYVREVGPSDGRDEDATPTLSPSSPEWSDSDEGDRRLGADRPAETLIAPVRQTYLADQEDHPVAVRE